MIPMFNFDVINKLNPFRLYADVKKSIHRRKRRADREKLIRSYEQLRRELLWDKYAKESADLFRRHLDEIDPID